MFSYREAITIGVMTHAALVPDPAALAAATVEELGALRRPEFSRTRYRTRPDGGPGRAT